MNESIRQTNDKHTEGRSIVKRILRMMGLFAVTIVSLLILLVLFVIASPNGRLALPVKHKQHFEHPNVGDFPSKLVVQGNLIIDQDGNPIHLYGLMPPDPARLDSRGMFNEDFYASIEATNANVIRIAVHPERWVRDPDYLWRHIDPIVNWAGELGMYVIIDWHYIGNIATGAGSEMPDIENPPHQLTREFWQLVAAYFRETPNVIYEIWNEPAGNISATIWQQHATEITQLIRKQKADQMIIVGGLDYSRDLSWVLENPVPDINVAYAAHIYPAHTSTMWDFWFGDISHQYPVIITEWGFMDEDHEDRPSYLYGNRMNYGEPFLSYLNDHGIGWIACWYDDEWLPPIFNPGWKTTTNYGAFVLEQLQER